MRSFQHTQKRHLLTLGVASADELYSKMAREAHQGWTTEYRKHYYESGFVMLAEKPGHPYIEKSKQVNKALGLSLDEFEDASQVREVYPHFRSNTDGLKAYVNQQGGSADTEESIRQLSVKCSLAGVSFITGPAGRVRSLRYRGNRVVGVNVAQGSRILAGQVILSAGAWTNRYAMILTL